jgi:hypothetical protein
MIVPIRCLLLALSMSHASSFTTSIPDNLHLLLQNTISTISSQTPQQFDLLASYQDGLKHHALPTQMATGATLAVAGDAIAQRTQNKNPLDTFDYYDTQRAVSFAVFDMAYRVLQHYAFPAIVSHCHGQYLGAIPFFRDNLDVFFRATMEQTLCNQLVIVPFLYYPAFFTLTGFLQGLSVEASVARAQETFFFLMKRNLLFWIPIQFIQFGFIEQELQIPFVCGAGLVWTAILSILAGSTKSYAQTPEEQVAEQMEEMLASQQAQVDIIPIPPSSSSPPGLGQVANATGANS